ncbi:MAG: GNAT family N-acetyltransferase [Prevotella sp.]|nr:GNAT family N-acetyltransferase [Prevotella sp.]MBO5204664.1 GNAT family N-acetyltransferase [Prevotella sp.]
MNENILLRDARVEDAPQVARMVMMAMTDECCKYFCGPNHTLDDFHQLMTSLVERTDTQYSHLNTVCAEDTVMGMVCGVCITYDGGKLALLRQPFWDAALTEWGMDHSNMSNETQSGELYLDSLAVLPDYRGQGIALALLRRAKEKAARMNLPLGLLVDCGNPKAEALYFSVGFRHVDDNMWGGHRMKHLQC